MMVDPAASYRTAGTAVLHFQWGTVEGPLVLDHISDGRARREFHSARYTEVIVNAVDKQYILRTAAFTPQPLQDLIGALTPRLQMQSGDRITGVKDRDTSFGRMNCIDIKHHYPGQREMCFEPSTGLLRIDDFGEVRQEFSDYAPVNGHWHPKKIVVYRDGFPEAEATVSEFGPASSADIVLAPPASGIVRDWCTGMTPPKLVAHPDPEFPKGVRVDPRKPVAVRMRVIVDKAGNVAEAIPLQSAGPFDKAATDAVNRWRFEPAMCGDKPVVDDIVVQVSFGRY
jgi:TonB family protein